MSSLPSSIEAVTDLLQNCSPWISTVRLGREGYISGLSLTVTNGEVVRLGYSTSRSEQSLELGGMTLTGFNLAVGLGGIQALQCVGTDSTGRHIRSAWLGFPNNVPITERLSRVTARGEMMMLELGFDVRHPEPFSAF